MENYLRMNTKKLNQQFLINNIMTLAKIFESIEELAAENMTEDGIHHDDWSDHEGEYVEDIIKDLTEINDK